MVVDDELDVQTVIATYLAEEKIAVLHASSNRDAIAQLDNKKEDLIDLILVNRHLPGSSQTVIYPIKPKAKNQDPEETFLCTPFTRKQLMEFIHQHI